MKMSVWFGRLLMMFSITVRSVVASKAEVARQTGRGINTVVRYWDILQGKAKLQPRARKSNTREQKISALNKKQIAYEVKM